MEGINNNINPTYNQIGLTPDSGPINVKTKESNSTTGDIKFSIFQEESPTPTAGDKPTIVEPTNPKTTEEICEDLTFILDNYADDSDVMLIVYELLMLLQEAMRQQRESMQMNRQSEYQISISNITAQAETLKDGANLALGLGIASAVIQGVAAVVNIWGSSKAAGNLKDMPSDLTADGAAETMGKLNKMIDIDTMKWQGIGGIINSVASMFDAGANFVSAKSQADAKLQEAESTKMEQQAAETSDLIKNMVDFITQLLDILKSVQNSQHDTNENIVRNI